MKLSPLNHGDEHYQLLMSADQTTLKAPGASALVLISLTISLVIFLVGHRTKLASWLQLSRSPVKQALRYTDQTLPMIDNKPVFEATYLSLIRDQFPRD